MSPTKTAASKGAAKSGKTAKKPGAISKQGQKALTETKENSTNDDPAMENISLSRISSNILAEDICDASEPLAVKWTPEDKAAAKIQSAVKGFLAKIKLQQKKKEKEEYEAKMDRLEKEAYAQMVKAYQKEVEVARKKKEEEEKQKREMAKRRKRMLDAAFDGDNNEIMAVLKEIKIIDDDKGIGQDIIGRVLRAKHQLAMVQCEDANGNTPLSEAASGGHSETIKLLIEHGADPNSRGQFKRTPLYRAAFAGHLEAAQTLLENGADPRIYADDGLTPEYAASFEPLQELLQNWNIEQTDAMLKKLDMEKNQRLEEDRQRRDAEASKLEDQISAAETEYRTMQKQMCKATGELNKRITEHDKAVIAGFQKTEITLGVITDAEVQLEFIKLELEKSRDRLAQLKLRLREKQLEGQDQESGIDDVLTGLKVHVRELDDVLLRDVGHRIRDSGKWPLIIDVNEQASTFLRYRDTNYINALNSQQMEPQKIRLAILGSLRYGKPLVLDMMQVDMFDVCTTRFDEVQKGLMDAIMDKTILSEAVYSKLIHSSDGDQYRKEEFNDYRINNFKFIIITKSPFPPEGLVERTYAIRICMPK